MFKASPTKKNKIACAPLQFYHLHFSINLREAMNFWKLCFTLRTSKENEIRSWRRKSSSRIWRFHCITNDAISLRRARRSKNGILVERVEFQCTMVWIWISISWKYFSERFDNDWCFFIYQFLQKSHFWNMIWMLQSGVKKFIC